VLGALLAERVESYAGINNYGNVATTFTALFEDLREYLNMQSAPPFRIVGKKSPTKKNGNLVSIGRALEFQITDCTVDGP
jgi:hypothetical protein